MTTIQQQKALVLAKEGDVEAIAALIRSSFHKYGIKILASRDNEGILLLTLNSTQKHSQSKVIGVIQKGLEALSPKGIDSFTATLYLNSAPETPVWSQHIVIKKPSASKQKDPENSNQTPGNSLLDGVALIVTAVVVIFLFSGAMIGCQAIGSWMEDKSESARDKRCDAARSELAEAAVRYRNSENPKVLKAARKVEVHCF